MLAHYYYSTDTYGIWYIACESALCELKFIGYDRLAVPQTSPTSSLATPKSPPASSLAMPQTPPARSLAECPSLPTNQLAASQSLASSSLSAPQQTLDEIIQSQAPLHEQPALLQNIVEQLDQYFKGYFQHFTIALDPQGTDFQKRVWQEACKIPYGNTASYKDISDKLQSSPRAVGQALKKNPILIIIPCHRVIQASKALGGYSAGADLKHKLQLHEMSTFTKEKEY